MLHWLAQEGDPLDYFKEGPLHKATHSTDTAVGLKQKPSYDPILLSSVFFTISRAHHPCLSLTNLLGRRLVLSLSTLLGLLRSKHCKCWWQAQLGLYFPLCMLVILGEAGKEGIKLSGLKFSILGFYSVESPAHEV